MKELPPCMLLPVTCSHRSSRDVLVASGVWAVCRDSAAPSHRRFWKVEPSATWIRTLLCVTYACLVGGQCMLCTVRFHFLPLIKVLLCDKPPCGCEDIIFTSVYRPDQLPTHRDGAGHRHPSSAELVCCFLYFGYKVHKVVDTFDILWIKLTLFKLRT